MLTLGLIRKYGGDGGKVSFSVSRNGGGDDIFVHRSSLVDGGILVQGSPVQFEVTWNAQKGQGHEGQNVDVPMNLVVFLWPGYIEKYPAS